MSQTIDQKVVEMQFNNAQFESNVKTSLSTLDKLKSALNFGGMTKGLDNLDKASKNISFDQVGNSLSALERRFSTMGIVGMTVIQNLTTSAINFAKNGIGAITGSIISGGKRRAFNIENAHFQLQGLLKDEEKVQAIMADAMDSVDGTAYAYDEAAKAASQFAASGMQAGEEMQSALRAITGVAAMTNSEYESISQIFTSVSGNGRLMGDDLLQLSSRGMNAAATITEYFNGVNNGSIEARDSVKKAIKEVSKGAQVTEGDIRQFVSKGKISFEMFSSAMDNAFGEHAKKANETFTGAMSNVRAALSRIGAEFVSPLIVQNGPLVTFFNTLRVKINEIKKEIGPLAELFTTTVTTIVEDATKFIEGIDVKPFFEKFNKGVQLARDTIIGPIEKLTAKDLFKLNFDDKTYAAFQKVLINTAKEHDIAIDEMIEKEGSFNATIKNGWLTSDIFKESIDKITGGKLTVGAKKTAEDLELIRKTATEVISGKWGPDWTSRIEELSKAGFSDEMIQNVRDYVNILSKLTGGTWNLTDAIYEEADAKLQNAENIQQMSDEQLENMGYTKEEIDLLREWAKTYDETGGEANEELQALLDSLNKPANITNFFKFIIDEFNKLKANLIALKSAFLGAFSSDSVSNLKDTLGGLWAILQTVWKTASAIVGPFLGSAAQVLGSVANGILTITGALGRFFTKLHEILESSGAFSKLKESALSFFTGIANSITNAINVAAPFIAGVIDKLTEKLPVIKEVLSNIFGVLNQTIVAPGLKILSAIIERINKRLGGLSDSAGTVKDALSKIFSDFGAGLEKIGFYNFLEKVWNLLKDIGSFAGGKLGEGFSAFLDSISNAKFNGILDFINTIVGVSLAKAIKGFLDNTGGFVESVTGVIDGVKDSFKAFQEELKSKTLKNIAIAIGILAASLLVLSFIDSDKLTVSLLAISALFGELIGAMTILEKVMGDKKIKKMSGTMIAMAASILILSIALKKISSIDPDKLGTSLLAVGALMAMMVTSTKALSVGKDGAMLKGAFQMILLAAAIKILAGVCKSLSEIDDPEALERGLVSIGILLGELALFTKISSGSTGIASAGIGLLLTAAAVRSLVKVVKEFSEIENPDALEQGLISLGMLLGELAIFTKVTSGSKGMISNGIGLLLIAETIKILAGICKTLGEMEDPDAVERGLIAIGMLLGELALFSRLTSGVKGTIFNSIGLLILAEALKPIVEVCKIFAEMEDPEALERGLVSVGILLAELALFTKITAGSKGMLKVGITIAILANSLKSICEVVKKFGKMKWSEIGKGLLTLAGVFVIFGVAGLVMGSVVVPLLLFSAALAVFGVAVIAFGAGITLIGFGLQALAKGIGDVGSAINENGKEAITGIGDMILEITNILPEIIKNLSGSVGEICDLIIDNAPKIGEALKAMLLEGLKLIDECAPQIIDTVLNLIVKALNSLATKGPEIGSALTAILTNAISWVTSNAGTFVNGIIDFFSNIFSAISERGPEIMEGIVSLGESLGELIGKFIGGIVSGFVEGISEKLSEAGTALSAFVENGKAFFDKLPDFKETGALEAVSNLVTIVMKMTANSLLDAITGFILGKSSAETFTETMTALGVGMTAFADNLGDSLLDSSKLQATRTLTDLVLSLVEGLPETGGLVQKLLGWKDLGKFGSDLVNLADGVGSYAEVLKNYDFDADEIQTSMLIGQMASSLANTLPDTGGLKQFINGYKDLGNFGGDLVSYAMGIGAYAVTLQAYDFDADEIQTSMMIGEMASSIANSLPYVGGLRGVVLGSQDLGDFGADLVNFAMGVGSYAMTLSAFNFDSDEIQTSMLIGQMASAIQNTLPPSGGIVQAIEGYKDLGGFGEELIPFAQGVGAYADVLQEYDFDKTEVETSMLIGQIASDIKDSLPKSNGILDKITGYHDLSGFGDELIPFAQGVEAYANAISGMKIDSDTVKLSGSIAQIGVDIGSQLPESGGLKQLITGVQDIGGFGANMAELGSGLSSFCSTISGTEIDLIKILAVTSVVKTLADVQRILSETTTADATAQWALDQFGGKIETFASSVDGYYEKMSKWDLSKFYTTASAMIALKASVENFLAIDFSPLEGIKKGLGDLGELTVDTDDLNALSETAKAIAQAFVDAVGDADISYDTVAESIVGDFADAIGKYNQKMLDAGKALNKNLANGFKSAKVKKEAETAVRNAIKAIDSKANSIKLSGARLALYLKMGLETYNSTISSIFTDSVISASNAVWNKYQSAYNAGSHFGNGLYNGMKDWLDDITEMANKYVSEANRIINKKAEINSPSKLFARSGSSLGEGFVLGMERMLPDIRDSASKMADASENGLSSALSRVSDLFEYGINSEPTIRPVVDMSNVESSAMAIDQMLAATGMIGMNGNIGALAYAMNGRIQNATNDDVISAINDLNKVLRRPGDIYNINGVTYDDGSNITDAVRTLVRAARVERRG